jgi:hypothetical protein
LSLSSSYSALPFSDYSFLVHHPGNQDDRQLLACAMASDFTVAWQFAMEIIVLLSEKNSISSAEKSDPFIH